MISIYTKASLSADPVMRFEHDAPLDAAIAEVLRRFPDYLGEDQAQDVPSRVVGWFRRADGRCVGVGYDVLPEPGSSLLP